MMVAQQLYEGIELGKRGGGSHNLYEDRFLRVAAEAQHAARNFIAAAYGKDFVPEKPPIYKSKASSQDAMKRSVPLTSAIVLRR